MSKRTGHPNSPIHPWKEKRQESRRRDAEERQKRYDAIPLEERLQECEKGLRGKKEYEKILRRKDRK